MTPANLVPLWWLNDYFDILRYFWTINSPSRLKIIVIVDNAQRINWAKASIYCYLLSYFAFLVICITYTLAFKENWYRFSVHPFGRNTTGWTTVLVTIQFLDWNLLFLTDSLGALESMLLHIRWKGEARTW